MAIGVPAGYAIAMQNATSSHNPEHVRANIRAELGRQNLKQNHLARRIGHDPAWVNRRLTGARNMRLADVYLIADALGVDVGQLLAPVRDTERNPGPRMST